MKRRRRPPKIRQNSATSDDGCGLMSGGGCELVFLLIFECVTYRLGPWHAGFWPLVGLVVVTLAIVGMFSYLDRKRRK